MSTENMIHSAETTSANRRSRPALFVISIILLAFLVAILITVQSRNGQAAKNSNIRPIVYSNALEMQYAQPWLDKAKAAAPLVPYSNALEMQYAQPWLDKQKIVVTPPVQYSHALEMQYAQPWLDKQMAQSPPPITYNDFLALFYAQPWLEKQQKGSCNGRLDEMYACQYGNWQPQK